MKRLGWTLRAGNTNLDLTKEGRHRKDESKIENKSIKGLRLGDLDDRFGMFPLVEIQVQFPVKSLI